MSDYVVAHRGMTCGSAEAESRTYRKVECSRGVWLIANQPNGADNVYFHNPWDVNSDGFSGRTLEFPLEDGTIYRAKGPWHGNSESLLRDTGVDIRGQHFTFVVLSKDRGSDDKYRTIMKDVVYQDGDFTLGNFSRWKKLAKEYPEAKYYYSESLGGSSCGLITERDLAQED